MNDDNNKKQENIIIIFSINIKKKMKYDFLYFYVLV